jgi:RHS repeat-associated protein
VANGLNQLTSIGGFATAHDARGNLTLDPTTGKAYTYSSENLLKTATGGVTLAYDPAMRLDDVTGAATTRFAYDGLDMIAEYNAAGALQRRFVHGPGADEPLVQYEGAGTSDRRWLHADERGSVVAISDASGNMLTINRYDEFGKPQATNAGRFQYTGQMWLSEIGLYHYKARAYAPHLGRFLQTDPIGYDSGVNVYAYVGNDPVNSVDPLGLRWITSSICVEGICTPGASRWVDDGLRPGDLINRGPGAGLNDPVDREGGDDGGASTTPKANVDPCRLVAQEQGRVDLKATTISLIFGAGINFTWGTFRNLRTGSTGKFRSYGAGLGLDMGGSWVYGWASSVSALLGYSETGSVSWNIGRWSMTGSVSYDANNQVTGTSGGVGTGPSLGFRAGGSATASDTSISACRVGRK